MKQLESDGNLKH